MSRDENEDTNASRRGAPEMSCNEASSEGSPEPRWKAAIRTFPPMQVALSALRPPLPFSLPLPPGPILYPR